MPQSSPPAEDQSGLEDSLEFTNQDVAILHEIIVTAQQSADVDRLPFRAIFAAYDQILALHGLDPDRDQTYLRFLFRLGDKKQRGQTLYENFETLLGELGIQLEFIADEDVTGILEEAINEKNTVQTKATNAPRGRSRRASFSSLYDAQEKNTRAYRRQRDDSRTSLSRLQNGLAALAEERSPQRSTIWASGKTLSPPSASAVSPARGRLTAEELANNPQHYQRSHTSASSQGSRKANYQGPHKALFNRSVGPRHSIDRNHEASSTSMDSAHMDETTSTRNIQPKPGAGPQEMFYQPSETQLLRDADIFQHYRTRSDTRDAVRKWHAAASHFRTVRQTLDRQASAYDSGILLRQAFDYWRLKFLAIRQALETEHFFNHVERRASRARDLYLLTKAFTHWAECAADEIQRTSVARRHILRTKFFNAWRDITVVNDLKVRRQGLRKFFRIWNEHFQRTLVGSTRAITVYYDNLARLVYWRWFWSFCGRRAPEWREARLRKRHFFAWVYAAHQTVQRNYYAHISWKDNTRRRVLALWLERTRTVLSCRLQATYFRRQKLIAHHVPEWKQRLQHAPLIRQVSNMVDWRVARSAFATLLTRSTVERQARYVSYLRIIRNAWTAWNDRLRWQTLVHQIDDRLLLQALYRWVLAERSLLLQRLHEQRVKRKVFVELGTHWERFHGHYGDNKRLVQAWRDRKCLEASLESWKSKLFLYRQRERLAFSSSLPRVAQLSLQMWTSSNIHTRQLQSWAADAAFYFRTSRTLKRWRSVVGEAQRQKRRNAYAQVRRRTKMNLARKVIHRWRNASLGTLELRSEAYQISLRRALAFGTALFDVWKSRAERSLDRRLQVNEDFKKSLALQCIQFWRAVLQVQWQIEERADLFIVLHISKIALGNLRRLQMRLLGVKQRGETAQSLKQWNEKRRHRALFRHWQERTARMRGQVSPDVNRLWTSRRIGPKDDRDSSNRITEHAEDLNAYEDDFNLSEWIPALEAQSRRTSLFGDISTPSKRAARTRASAKISTTPATPIGGSLVRALYSQLGTNIRPSRRIDLARSIFTMRRDDFDDIPETVSTTPGG